MELGHDYQELRKNIRQFVEAKIASRASEIDQKEEFPSEILNELGKLGYLGIPYPEEYGGVGLDTLSYAIVVEEISRVCGSTGLTVAAHTSLPAGCIYLAGNEEQKKRYLTPLAKGEKLGAFGLTEPNAGSDAARIETRAVREGDYYIINGTKIFITSGEVADVVVITAMTDKSKGTGGISAFILEKGTPGFRYGKKEKKLGVRGSQTVELVFQDCSVPRDNLLGQEGEGYKIFLKALDGGRVGIGAMAVGIAQGSFEAALKYAKERIQFGKPIAEFQAIQWMLADMATGIEAARQLVYHAAQLKDSGLRFTKEAAMAKLFASEVAMKVTTDAIQIHGGYGYMKDYAVERMFRDAKLCEIGEGTSEIQRLVIARTLLKGW